MKRISIGRAVLTVAAATTLLGVTAPTGQAETNGGVVIPSFYDPPTTLPAANGAIIRQEPVKLAVSLNLPGIGTSLPANATLLMYKSTDSNGQPVAVTGTYLEPAASWLGVGPRPLVTFAEGTQGQGDQCAPSYGLTHGLVVSPTTLQVNYEIPSIYALLSQGVAVVVTDYVGLGTTDRLHTYTNRVDEGHAVLDAARAARQVTGASATSTSPVATYGYSQGGGAAASADELQPGYAPDINLVAGYAGAPPADLLATLKGIDGTSLVGAIGWAINGFMQSDPSIRPVVKANLNPTGAAALAKLTQECTIDAIANFGFKNTSSWTNSGQSLSTIIAENPAALAVVDAQRIGRLKPAVPVRIVSGTQDDLVNHAQVKQLALDWCALGANVTYTPIPQLLPGFGTGVNHIGAYLTDAFAAQTWIVARLRGLGVSSGCALVPSQQ